MWMPHILKEERGGGTEVGAEVRRQEVGSRKGIVRGRRRRRVGSNVKLIYACVSTSKMSPQTTTPTLTPTPTLLYIYTHLHTHTHTLAVA